MQKMDVNVCNWIKRESNKAAEEKMGTTIQQERLDIIEEGLQLKLEIQGIKEQFLNLLNNFDQFDGKDNPVGTPKKSTAQKGISAARARVRALYEARKARMAAKRSASNTNDENALPPSKHPRVDPNDEDKENIPSPRVSARESRRRSNPGTPSGAKTHGICACHPRSVLKKLLTPIKEERLSHDQCHKCAGTATPASKKSGKSSTARGLEGEYVILKSPMTPGGDYVTLASPGIPPAPFQTPVSNLCNTPDDTSIWDDTLHDAANRSDITVELSSHAYSSPERNNTTIIESPVKYAKSHDITELYCNSRTSPRNLSEVSLISRVSRTSLREQVSSCNLSGAFHSTFNYPLHSTLNHHHNSLDISDIPMAPRTTTVSSDPSSIPRDSSDSGDSEPMRTLVEANNNSEGFVTPVRNMKQMKQPQLCKEHGMHPTFGGPCIFQNDDSVLINSDDDEDIQQKTVIETDCDSSYLSECVDDVQLSQAEDYMPTYDARSGHMRMMKRQTGHIQLKNVQTTNWDPIGLSESDLYLDMSRKHMSMDATRASIPDVSALTMPGGDITVNIGRSLLSCKGRGLSPNSTLISLDDDRPLSVSTTDESPESTSTHGMPVPLNSPNITTSGSSSSRPNTDTYDYAEMPSAPVQTLPARPMHPMLMAAESKKTASKQKRVSSSTSKPAADVADSHSVFLVPVPPKPVLPKTVSTTSTRRHHPASSTSSRRSHAASCQDTKSLRSSKSTRSIRTAVTAPVVTTTRGEERGKSQPRHDCDSGFSTQGSRPRTRRQALAANSHFTISDNAGVTRTVVQHSAVGRNLQHDRKKQIVKKLKRFNSNLYKEKSTGNLHIETLGHF